MIFMIIMIIMIIMIFMIIIIQGWSGGDGRLPWAHSSHHFGKGKSPSEEFDTMEFSGKFDQMEMILLENLIKWSNNFAGKFDQMDFAGEFDQMDFAGEFYQMDILGEFEHWAGVS